MKNLVVECDFARRRLLRTGVALGGTALAGAGLLSTVARAQDPPNGCPAPPTGGTHFQPGQDTRPITLRIPISAMSAQQLTELQNAYAALRGLGTSDPRSWLLQADLHAWYCMQCSNTVQIHGSWNFFPWHRAYLYFYERILGSLVGNLDRFRLPYWDWEAERAMPSVYRTPAAIGNSLWDQLRNSNIEGGGNLPIGHGDAPVIAQLLDQTPDFATFGGDVLDAGACEGNPHGVIHNDIGQPPLGPRRDMGNLGFAARDPIFFAHHANIDKLWSDWNSRAGGSGSKPNDYRNPTDTDFLNATWSFYDENSKVVSIRATDVLDHNTNLRYTYKPVIHIRRVYFAIPCRIRCCGPDPERGSILVIPEESLQRVITAARTERPTTLVVQGVEVPPRTQGNFEVFAVRGERKLLLGSFGIVGEPAMRMEHGHRLTLMLDATRALADLAAKEHPATLRIVPERGVKGFELRAKGAELRIFKSERAQTPHT